MTIAAGLASAMAVAAPAHEASITGAAPASVKACDNAPAGRPVTIRIGPCRDMRRLRRTEKPAEGAEFNGPPLTPGQRDQVAGAYAALGRRSRKASVRSG